MLQILSLLGAFSILGAYCLVEFFNQRRYTKYYLLNLAGSVLLLIPSISNEDYGLIILQVAWAIISIWALLKIRFPWLRKVKL